MTKLLLLPAIGIPVLVVAALAVSGPSIFRDESESIPDAASDSAAASCAAAEDHDEAQSVAEVVTPTPDTAESVPTPEPTVHYQTEDEAVAQDLALIAESQGWTIEEAAAHVRGGNILDDIAGQVLAQRPEIYVGGALPEDPLGAPELYIKGPADDFVRSLVAGVAIDIRIVDNQPFSSQEIEDRQTQVSRALQALGFENFAVGSTMTEGGRIEADVIRQAGLPDDPAEILAAIPAEVRDSVTITVIDGSVGVADEQAACISDSPSSDGSRGQTAENRDFGPLAVIEARSGDLALGGTGPVDIGETCVTMALPNGETLLPVWPASQVRWNEDRREIIYSSAREPDREPVRIRDGDTITVGGSSLVAIERIQTWLARPHPDCSGEPWGFSNVTTP